MKVQVQSVNSFQKKLTVTIPPERVRNQLDTAYRRLAGQVRLHGFRPGKAPRRVLEAKFGEQIEADVASDLIQTGWRSAVAEHDISPVSQPNLSDSGAVKSADGFTFTILVDVRPEIDLSNYTGVEVVYPKVEIGADELESAVKARLEGQAKLEEVTDRAITAGDLALVELVCSDGDDEVHREPGTMIRTEGDPYFPGIEAALVGLETGSDTEISVTFGEEARTDVVAGRTLDVQIKVMSIQSYAVPDLTDDLADEMGFEGGVDGMRVALDGQLRSGREELARNQARANVLEALIAANPFDVPDGMVQQSLQMLVEELRMAQAYRTGRDPKEIGFSEAQIADLRVRAQFAAKAGLILEYVGKAEGLDVTDGDLDSKYAELAEQSGQTVEAVKGRFLTGDNLDELRDRVLEEKTLDWLLEKSVLVDPPPVEAAPAAEAEEAPKKPAEKKAKAPKKEAKAPKKESAPAPEAAPANKKANAPKKAAPSDDLGVLDGAIGAIKTALASGDHDGSLSALLTAETEGKARKGALAAIQGRIDATA